MIEALLIIAVLWVIFSLYRIYLESSKSVEAIKLNNAVILEENETEPKSIIRKIKSDIEDKIYYQGKWEKSIEWGASKETHVKISKTILNEQVWYEVIVKFDHEFKCCCPSLERAAEFADIYHDLIANKLLKHGLPSWSSANSS